MRFALISLLLTHGVSHLAAFQNLPGRSALALWLAMAGGFIAAAMGVWLRADWWLPAVTLLVVVSLISCTIWWNVARWGVAANVLVMVLMCMAVRYPGDAPAVRSNALEALWNHDDAPAVRLVMTGKIRLGGWRPFIAEQVIDSKRGMIWTATVSLYGLPVVGADSILEGKGAMTWRLFGLLPVAVAEGPDIRRSAEGRMAGEMAAWLPGVERPAWMQEQTTLRMDVDPEEELTAISFARWGNPDGGAFTLEPFGVDVLETREFNGRRIPAVIDAGWYYGTPRFEDEGKFFKATVTRASFR